MMRGGARLGFTALCVAVCLTAGPVPVQALDSGVTYSASDPYTEVLDVNPNFLLVRRLVVPNVSSIPYYNIYIERISTGARVWLGQTTEELPSAALCDSAPFAVIARATASGSRIEVRNLVTGAQTSLGYGSEPSAGRDTVAFVSTRDGTEDIWTFDCATGTLAKAVAAPGAQVRPAVGNDRLCWVDYRTGSAEIRSMSLLGGPESVLASPGDLDSASVLGNDRWIVWEIPRVLVTASGDKPDPNSALVGFDATASSPTTVAVGECFQMSASVDRLAWSTANFTVEGMNDTIYLRGTTLSVAQALSSGFAPPYTIGRATASGYTFIDDFALCGNVAYWGEYWKSHTIRVTSITSNCTLAASTLTPVRGAPVVLTARVTTKSGAPVANALVAFDVWNGTRWSQIAGGRTYSHGMRQLTQRPTAPTRYRVRVLSTTAPPSMSWQVAVTPR